MDERLRFVAAAREKKESTTELCRRLGPVERLGDGTETRWVTNRGCLVFRSDSIFITEALAGEVVLLELLDVYFLDFHIGRIDTLFSTTKSVTVCYRGNGTDETGLMGDTPFGLKSV